MGGDFGINADDDAGSGSDDEADGDADDDASSSAHADPICSPIVSPIRAKPTRTNFNQLLLVHRTPDIIPPSGTQLFQLAVTFAEAALLLC
jgi:hypothetical protein